MSALHQCVSQLKNAAKELLGNVAAIDKQIAELDQQRDALTSGNVSKADFLEYLRAYFKRQSMGFQNDILKSLNNTRSFARLESPQEDYMHFNNCLLLIGRVFPVPVSQGAIYFYFSDIMVERLSKALDELEWPVDSVPVELRRTQIENLKMEIDGLMQQRAELVAMLADAGITGR